MILFTDRLTLAQRKQFGASSEKYADGYEQMNLFNGAEQESGLNAPEPDMEEITYVYSCPKCSTMVRTEKKTALLKGSIASPSLVAGIMNGKYVNGMLLARQEREFARYDLNLSTKTMANWIILCADRYLQPLYDLMKKEFLKSRYTHCDETRIQVLDEPEQNASPPNWMWVYLTDEYSGSPRMVLLNS